MAAQQQQQQGEGEGHEQEQEQFRAWPEQIDMRDVDTGLLRFCLTHGTLPEEGGAGIPARDPADYRWLREALDAMEDDAKKMLKLIVALRGDGGGEGEATDPAAALARLQELVEDVSNANDFPRLGGVAAVAPLLAHAAPAVRANAAWVLGTIAANNAPGQRALVVAGAVAALARALRVALAADADDAAEAGVALKALTALGCAVRAMPDAAAQLETERGSEALLAALRHPSRADLRMRAAQAIGQLATAGAAHRDAMREAGALDVLADAATRSAGDDDSGAARTLRERALFALCRLVEGSPANAAALRPRLQLLRRRLAEAKIAGDAELSAADLLTQLVVAIAAAPSPQ